MTPDHYLGPEAEARLVVSAMLSASGWAVQDFKKFALAVARGRVRSPCSRTACLDRRRMGATWARRGCQLRSLGVNHRYPVGQGSAGQSPLSLVGSLPSISLSRWERLDCPSGRRHT